jgi:hypothetical protein
MSETRPPIAAGPIDLTLKFLNKISFSCGGADSVGEAADAGEPLGETEDAGEALGIASGAPGVDGRVPSKVADGACAMAEKAKLTVIRTTVFIEVTSSLKPTGCRLP